MSMEWKDPINTEDTAKEEARKRIEARRVAREERHRRRKIVSTTALAASSLCLGIILGVRITTGSRELQIEPPAPTIPTAEIGVAVTPPTIVQPVARWPLPDAEPVASDQTETEPEPEPEQIDSRAMSDATPTLLPSVPLDKETQRAIFELCDNDTELFCSAMAIAYKESRFTPAAVGDDGRSIGMMQINQQWHTERMERLGTTDLTDPIQSAAVGIDYLKELTGTFGWVDGEKVYIAYNAGAAQASEWIANGVASTAYSREALALYHSYLTEMEAQG